MYRERGAYSIHLIFRGLFLAWPSKGKLSVFLPDVREPGPSKLSPDARIREHTAAIEFPVRNWKDRTPGSHVLEVSKPNKEPVALSFLDGHEIAVSSRNGTLRTPSVPSAVQKCCNRKLMKGKGSSLLVLDDDPEHEIQALSRFESKLAKEPRSKLVGWIELDRGFARSERRSVLEVSPVQWWEVTRQDAEAHLAERMTLTELDAKYTPRFMNLDLRVTLAADLDDPLIVDLRKDGAAVRTFMLSPSEPGTDVSVWIKNWELKAILEDSDDLADKSSGCPRAKVDIDHEAFKNLSAQKLDGVTIPVLARLGDSDGGCGCGGKCGGGSG